MFLRRVSSALESLPIPEMLVGAALLIAACTSIFLTSLPGGISLFWPGSAIAATLLIRMKRVRWSAAVPAIVCALLLSNVLAAHRPWAIGAAFAAINVVEIALMVVAFRHVWRCPYPAISISQAALMTSLLGIVIPGIGALAGGVLMHLQFGSDWTAGAIQWWTSHTVGACLLGPPIILFSVKEFRRLVRPQFLIQNVLTVIAGLIGCYLMIRYVRFPFVTMGLLLLITAFRLGGLGASLMSLSFGLLITNLWAMGIRPLGLDPGLLTRGTLLGLPVVALLATVMPPIAVGLGSDARRIAAKALRISERRFRESMAHSPIGMLIAGLDGTWQYTNLALQRMLGYSAEEFQSMPPGGPSKTDEWKRSESRWSKLLAGEIDFYDVTRSFRHNDGHWVWTHVAVSLLRDDDGVPVNLIAQIESLEARQLAEEHLAAERERLRITLASINDAVITTDAATRITYINAAAESLLKLDMQAVENRRLDEVMHLVDADTSKTAANLVGRSAHHGKVFRREKACILHRPDGSVCYIQDVVSPVLAETGILTGLVIVLRDATADVERSRDLVHQALHDPLTGLSNRAEFNSKLQNIFLRASHTGRSAAVIAIDLDKFKAVNDSAGHAAGDAVLCKVADACRAAVRASDTVARLGGDEFSIILDDCGEEQATRIANKLLQALNPIVIEWNDTYYMVHASLGLAMRSERMIDSAMWVVAADEACYAAKHQGRARLQIAATTVAECHR